MQLVVNETWLFRFCPRKHDCDVNFVKNYVKSLIN